MIDEGKCGFTRGKIPLNFASCCGNCNPDTAEEVADPSAAPESLDDLAVELRAQTALLRGIVGLQVAQENEAFQKSLDADPRNALRFVDEAFGRRSAAGELLEDIDRLVELKLPSRPRPEILKAIDESFQPRRPRVLQNLDEMARRGRQ